MGIPLMPPYAGCMCSACESLRRAQKKTAEAFLAPLPTQRDFVLCLVGGEYAYGKPADDYTQAYTPHLDKARRFDTATDAMRWLLARAQAVGTRLGEPASYEIREVTAEMKPVTEMRPVTAAVVR